MYRSSPHPPSKNNRQHCRNAAEYAERSDRLQKFVRRINLKLVNKSSFCRKAYIIRSKGITRRSLRSNNNNYHTSIITKAISKHNRQCEAITPMPSFCVAAATKEKLLKTCHRQIKTILHSFNSE